MKRPFVTLCIFLLTGITVSYLFNYFIPVYYIVFAVLFASVFLLIYERAFNILFLFTIFILGIYLYGQGVVGDTLLENVNSNSIIKAKILKEASSKKGYNQYEVELINIFKDSQSKAVKINKKAQLNIYESKSKSSIDDFNVGDIIEIKNANIIELLKDYRKDNINDYELFLKSRGLQYILNVNIENVTKNNIDLKYADISNMSYRAKIYLENFLDSTLEFENSKVLKSIIFGNQGYLSKDKLEKFSKTGTAHIMAVSGLHVGLMVLIIDRFLRLIKISKSNRLYITISVLIFYGYIVYFPVSIIRAGAMYLLYVIAYFLQRRYDSINALFFIAFVLLIYNPMTIFSISFQLSFVATLSILLFTPVLNEKLSKLTGVLSSLAPLISVTLAAQIGTMPIMAYHFKQISLISIATNILIIPLIAPMLSTAFASILLGAISFRLGFLTNKITDNILNYINWITIRGAAIPYASIEVSEIKFIHILGYYVILVFIYSISCKRGKSNPEKERLVKTYEL